MVRITCAGLTLIVLAACSTTMTTTTTKEDFFEEYAEPSIFLREEIKERIAMLPLQTGDILCENMQRLMYIGEPAIPYLLEGLENSEARTRGSCAYMLGQMGDRRTIEGLKDALGDSSAPVRYEAATALCSLGVREGYPILIDGLSDDEIRYRFKAHEALQLLTRLDYGYRHDDAPGERRVAVARWEQWWERMKASDV